MSFLDRQPYDYIVAHSLLSKPWGNPDIPDVSDSSVIQAKVVCSALIAGVLKCDN